MRTPRIVVRRSAQRMWAIALLGIPFIVLAADLLLQRRLLGPLQEMIFAADDIQQFELRDTVWGWVMLMVGSALTGWGLKELLAPRRVLEVAGGALRLAVGGPFRRPVAIPWEKVAAVAVGRLTDESGDVPALLIEVTDRAGLPAQPWGARWVGQETLAVRAADWDAALDDVAHNLSRLAEAAAEPPG